MNEQPLFRKRVRHYNEPGHVHELTFSCYQRKPLLLDEEWNRLLAQSVEAAAAKQGFDLLAFVFMPEHVHLLVSPRSELSAVEQFLYAVKRPFSFRVKQRMLTTGDRRLPELTIVERPGKTTFRFWQEGPGYDRNITLMEEVIVAAEYLHNNPVKRGLCASPSEWKWSSWKHYCPANELVSSELPTVHAIPGWTLHHG